MPRATKRGVTHEPVAPVVFDPKDLHQGIGPTTAKIVIVQDYPSRDEYLQSRISLESSVGKSVGHFLKPTKLQEVYRTSFVRTPIIDGNVKDKKIRKEAYRNAIALTDWTSMLSEELKYVDCNVIVPLGDLALEGLTGKRSVFKYRGSILQALPAFNKPNVKVIPTHHPREIWQDWIANSYVTTDWRKIQEYKDDPKPWNNPLRIWICQNLTSLNNWWSRVSALWRQDRDLYLDVDIETYRGFITCIGFSHDGIEGMSVPLYNHSSYTETAMIWQKVNEILSSGIGLVNQNMSFDDGRCAKWGLQMKNVIGCSMLLAHTTYPELPKDLGFLVSMHTKYPYHKDDAKGDDDPEGKHNYDPRILRDKLYLYNGTDAATNHAVYQSQIKDAKEAGVWDFYTSYVMPWYHIYKKIQRRGIRVDIKRRDILRERYESIASLHQNNLDTISGAPINVRSTPQMREFVFNVLGCKERPKLGKEDIEEIYLTENPPEGARKALKEVILIRKAKTILNYITAELDHNNRLLYEYKLGGSVAGRTSASESYEEYFRVQDDKLITGHYGCSPQVLPKRKFEMEEFEGTVLGKDVPSMFIPDDGFCFVEGDGAAAEARVVAVLAEDWETLEFMNRKIFKKNRFGIKDDIHTLTAMWCTEKPFEEINEMDRENKGKRPRHAGNYDMGAYRLALMIHYSLQLCAMILERFHKNAPKIRTIFHATVRYMLDHALPFITPHGRRRDFLDRRTDKYYKQAFSAFPQSVVSDHTKSCLIDLREHDNWFQPLIEKHDSLTMQASLNRKEEGCVLLANSLQRPIDFTKGSIPRNIQLVIPAEIQTSETNWGDMQKFDMAA